MRNEKTRRVALLGLLFALTTALSFLESLVAPFVGLPPGVKLGLANIVVMYALLFLGGKSALLLALLKSLFVLLTRGATAGLLSLGGGLLSLGVMLLLALRKEISFFILSACGAIAHNLGQLLVLRMLMLSVYTLYYLPILLVSGLGMGALTACCLKALIPALKKLGFSLLKINDIFYQ